MTSDNRPAMKWRDFMTNLNSDICELSMDELQSVSGGFTFSFLGNTIRVGTDQTGAPYVAFHGADGTNSVTRGEPK
jgi:bacteriocin-like protein